MRAQRLPTILLQVVLLLVVLLGTLLLKAQMLPKNSSEQPYPTTCFSKAKKKL
jgi:hypothetical protein